TPLFDRLKSENRLHDNDAADVFGTNVIPLGMSPAELRDGFMKGTQECYSADSYFERLDAQCLDEGSKFSVHHLPYWSEHRWAWAKRCFLNYCRFAVVASRLLLLVDDQKLRLLYKH